MDETTPPVEAGSPDPAEGPAAEPHDDGTSSAAPPRGGRVRAVLSWLALVVLAVFVGVQVAGVLLRDRLEHRRPLLARPPAAEPAEKTSHEGPRGPEPSRFGPEIQEVVVARGVSETGSEAPPAHAPEPPVSPPPAPEKLSHGALPPPPAPTAKAPPAAAPSPHAAAPLAVSAPVKPASPSPKPAVPAPPKAPTAPAAPPAPAKTPPAVTSPPAPAKQGPPPAPKGDKPVSAETGLSDQKTQALLVGVFLGQEYLKETEQRLKALHVPSLRTELLRKGPGFKVQTAGGTEGDRDKARKFLEAGGYIHKVGAASVEAYFLYRREAQAVVNALAARGVSTTTAPAEGERPYWKLYAGPFTAEEAEKAGKKLAAAGFEATVEPRP